MQLHQSSEPAKETSEEIVHAEKPEKLLEKSSVTRERRESQRRQSKPSQPLRAVPRKSEEVTSPRNTEKPQKKPRA